MVKAGEDWDRHRNRHAVLQGIYNTTFYLGAALRRTVDLVVYPYVVLANYVLRKSPKQFRESRRTQIVSRLSRMKDRLQSLEHSLRSSDRLAHSEVTQNTLKTIRRTSDEVSAALAEALSDRDAGVRKHALGNIEEFAGDKAGYMIVEDLHDPEPSVRCAAAKAAARIGASATVFSLILSLDDPVPQVRQEAKVALESITGRKLEFDPQTESPARQKTIDDLKDWWKKKRFEKLAADVQDSMKS